MLLPQIRSLSDYRQVYRNEDAWLPAMRAVCDRHGLDKDALVFAPPGTHVVFGAGTGLYVKLFSPLWGTDHPTERAVLRALARRSHLPVPRLLAEGEIEGWPYLVMAAVPGTPWGQVRCDMDAHDQVRALWDLGAFLAELHAVPADGLEAIAVDWPAFLREQADHCLEQVRQSGLDRHWIRSVSSLLDDVVPALEQGSGPVLLNADVTDEHVLVSERSGRWQFTGLIDFGDAMLGHPLYEFAAPGCSITRGEPGLQRALLCAYGFSGDQLNKALADRLMACTLLHRYIGVPDLLGMFEPDPPANLDDLERTLWSFA